MSESNRPTPSSHGYWQSLNELSGDEAFLRGLESEFPEGADAAPEGVSRRQFLQIMSASAALAGLAGCGWPEEEIIPFDRRPESYNPGRIKRFATTLDVAGAARPVLVSSYDGRPIKIEGNPDHELSGGGTDAVTQALVLELYDRDRSRKPRRGGAVSTWQAFEEFAAGHFGQRADEGRGVAFLMEPLCSPSVAAQVAALRAKLPRARWFEHAPAGGGQAAEGAAAAFEGPVSVSHSLAAARVIADFDADLLVAHPEALRNARDFAAGRRRIHKGEMNRLYCFEAVPTATGAAADHRFALRSSRVALALAVLARRLRDSGQLQQPEMLAGVEVLAAPARMLDDGVARGLEALASDLLENQGRGVVVLGARQPAGAHALAQRINQALGNAGRTVIYAAAAEPPVKSSGLPELVREMRAGKVDTLLVLGANPVYSAAPELEFAQALEQVATRIHFGLYVEETAALCDWHLPQAHALESWGDLRDVDGRLCLVQPLIKPLYQGRSLLEFLALLTTGTPQGGYELVRRTFFGWNTDGQAAGGAESSWRRYAHDGFVGGTNEGAPSPRASMPWRRFRNDFVAKGTDAGLEVELRADPKLYDGRYANNAWLQELPDAMTKLTWDNAALVGAAAAAELRVEHGDVALVTVAGRQLEIPVYVLPGMALGAVAIALGYGRGAAGRVGTGVGVNAYALRAAGADWWFADGSLKPVGRKVELACTQDHFAIDTRGREERMRRVDGLVREGSVEEYEQHPEFAVHLGVHHPPLKSLWKEHEGEGHQWGMAIDLNTCIACNACVVACQAENNIPVVGKEQVARGREMHWMRIDRYFHGEPDTAEVAHQPMACLHCELAPCEQVCPVGATMHSTEGINMMAYNRCIGTRYCSNNCPYKTRRFNFFNYHKDVAEVEKLGNNPEVTLRSRGVMEKCTYCVQRIEHARIDAKNAGREMADGDVVTACQQTCPTQAIVFGDLADPKSRVSQAHADSRAYALLGELNIKPRTLYLARIRNPHPLLAAAEGHGDAHAVTPEGGHHG
jgi:molybdopterin-containing oxidoreductase family iron-sulfur binding subunit